MTIGAQLDALEAQHADAGCEVIVSDNGSTDDTAEVARGYSARHPWIKLIDSSDRPGVAHARNVGVDAASAASIAFCDQDDVVGAGWLAAMVSALEQHEFVAGRLEHDLLNPPWVVEALGRPQAEGLLWYEEGGHLPFAFGCTLGVRKEIHHTAGGFDERFVKGAEDTDYCWRLQLLGHRLVFIPDAVTHYRFRHDLVGLFRQARAYGESEVQLYKKHQAVGLPRLRRPWVKALRLWLGAIRATLRARDRARRATAAWTWGQRIGRLTASLTQRVPFP
jgi:GT2 family glycosyltransferase